MITSRGIEANPEKCKAIIQMQSPQIVKDVQCLAGRLVSLSRFIPSFQELQSFPSNSTNPLETGSSCRPESTNAIYFISRVLQDTEKRYQMIEKLALALLTAARRLRPYFQSHQVVVKADYPIKQILRKPELARQMITWLVELSEFSIKYESQGLLKAQCLVDFVAELTPTSADEQQVWTLHVDGSSKSKGGGAGIILEMPNKVTLEQSLKFGFKVTNNQAEYEALLAGLRLAHDLGARKVSCNSDSKLMVEQLSGAYQTKDTLLQRYFDVASQQISSFEDCQHQTIIQETLNSPSLDDKVVNTSDSHSRARSMATRVLRAGYYWPTLNSICQTYVQRCKECQQFSNTRRQLPEVLHQMTSPWPFAQWGMDILGPFPPAKGQLKFLLVAIDYFTKWIEACPLARITTENVQKFTWKSIICRFGIPHSLVTDNGK
uniref:Gypsy retrotransposon integrase-like protein 1 n=1 Tax=Cajanus cajan TaxID=3821 RepID=A0A151U0D2_CAJCA|nr:Gypsy retrotransposon integrase-like protein 1 [Cajanus cajan]